MRYKIAYSPGECCETDGWMQVGATHIERHRERRLVCELYPGVLVVEGGRVQTMLSFGDEVETLPDDLREAFTIPGRQAQTAADRFGDLVDFAALSRYFDGPHRIRTALPPGAWARPAWTARAVAGLPMLEVRVTHFTTIPGSRTLVCEPGILVVAKYGLYGTDLRKCGRAATATQRRAPGNDHWTSRFRRRAARQADVESNEEVATTAVGARARPEKQMTRRPQGASHAE